jgi:Xaa-Pro dipeptidase
MITQEQLKQRIKRFQQLMKENKIDSSLIRTLSSFVYFTGIKWLRPSLLIPADGDPTAFIFKYEAEQFKEMSGVEKVKTYTKVEELMKHVTGTIRESGFKTVGFDYSLERDAYVFYFELFKKMNAKIKIPDIHALIMQLRMVKDEEEIEHIRKSVKISEIGMQKAVNTVEAGRTEVEVAAEVLGEMMNMTDITAI